eukprot:COSAG01_NODE_75018_length_199_cov_23.180000_1_plen_37_part_01
MGLRTHSAEPCRLTFDIVKLLELGFAMVTGTIAVVIG